LQVIPVIRSPEIHCSNRVRTPRLNMPLERTAQLRSTVARAALKQSPVTIIVGQFITDANERGRSQTPVFWGLYPNGQSCGRMATSRCTLEVCSGEKPVLGRSSWGRLSPLDLGGLRPPQTSFMWTSTPCVGVALF
jgi:hypothetical protein